MSEAGKYHDRRGVPIYPGDLLKTDHFVGRRGKRYYLYHTVVEVGDHLEMVPTSHLEPTLADRCGRCRLSSTRPDLESLVINGFGPGDLLSYEDRPRVRPTPEGGAA